MSNNRCVCVCVYIHVCVCVFMCVCACACVLSKIKSPITKRSFFTNR